MREEEEKYERRVKGWKRRKRSHKIHHAWKLALDIFLVESWNK